MGQENHLSFSKLYKLAGCGLRRVEGATGRRGQMVGLNPIRQLESTFIITAFLGFLGLI